MAGLFLFAVACAVAGFVALRHAPPTSGVASEVGRWLLQLATVFTGAGFITAVFRQIEVTRVRREAWTEMLQDLVVAQDVLESAFLRLIRNTSSETYTDMIERCREMRAMLRRIIALPEADDRPEEPPGELRREVQRMRHYLKPLVLEYEQHCLRILRQGRLDAKVLEARLAVAAEGDQPVLSEELLKPASVATLILDPKEFPALAACQLDFDGTKIQFKEHSELDSAYERVKGILRKNAGVARA
jgi:hypothetical protein